MEVVNPSNSLVNQGINMKEILSNIFSDPTIPTSGSVIDGALSMFTQAQDALSNGIELGNEEAKAYEFDIEQLQAKLTATTDGIAKAKAVHSNISKLLNV